MMFKKVLFDDFHSMLLSSLLKFCLTNNLIFVQKNYPVLLVCVPVEAGRVVFDQVTEAALNKVRPEKSNFLNLFYFDLFTFW